MKIQPRLKNIFNKVVKPSLSRYEYNEHIEQYRGLCALLVIINHGTVHEDLLINNFQWPAYMHYLGSPFLSVLLFFCISGYVIGINYNSHQFNAINYLKRRAIRLYPIYIISIALCMIVADKISLFQLMGNLLFLQTAAWNSYFKVPIFINYATWSLHFEMIYYLFFIVLFYWQPKLWKLVLGLFITATFLGKINVSLQQFAYYANLFYFWLLGLLIGWNIFKNKTSTNNSIAFLSLLFLHLCQTYLGFGTMVLHLIGIHNFDDQLSVIFLLPFCLLVMSTMTGLNNQFLRFNKILNYVLPALVFAYLFLHHRLTEDIRWIMCLIYWGLSLLFYFETKISRLIMSKLTVVGKISYALYLLHIPIGYLIKKTIFIQNQTIEIIVKYVLWITLTFLLSYLLERVMQPAIKRFFFPKPAIQPSITGS